MATIEINDIEFCKEHIAEVCEDCDTDLREGNNGFYGFDFSVDRDTLTCPPVSTDDNGIYLCDKHEDSSCNVCFNWKKQITRLIKEAKTAGR